jgi:hypothetical protein
MMQPARASNWISLMPMFASRHGFVAAMWHRTLARLRNMHWQRWESSPYDVQCGPPRAPRRPYVRWLTFTVSCQCATLVSELQCKCIMIVSFTCMLGLVHMLHKFRFVRSQPFIDLLLKYSSKTTRLSAGRSSALQLANAVALTRRKIQNFMRFC